MRSSIYEEARLTHGALTQEIPVHRVLYRTRKDTVGQKIGEPLKTLKMDKKWSGWVQNVKLC